LGERLLELLVQIARDEKIKRITADILPDNVEMQHIAKKLGFSLKRDLEESVVHAEIKL
jgi:acetyltransferase